MLYIVSCIFDVTRPCTSHIYFLRRHTKSLTHFDGLGEKITAVRSVCMSVRLKKEISFRRLLTPVGTADIGVGGAASEILR